MRKSYRKNNVLTIVVVVALVLLVLGLFGVFAKGSEVDDNGKIETQLTFEIGGLNEAGKYVDTDKSLYTKDAFECKGLEVLLDFEAELSYKIYFYDEDGNYIANSCTEELTNAYKEDIPEGAVKARIVITPIWNSDVKAEDRVVTIFNKYKYINDIYVKILEDQETVDIPSVE